MVFMPNIPSINKPLPKILSFGSRIGVGSYGIGRNSMSLANVGFANAFKFNDKIGMEANANVGFSLINFLPPWNYDLAPGINYGAEVKFRFKALAVGLDYSRMDARQNEGRISMNIYSITIGAKF